ncbi:hypothetical protein HanPI659440_Chr14g0572721 [Helianthus annuus]|nr:hypothetical protein HanPI659440_Chr14g0572721 [Helianthus annuus]
MSIYTWLISLSLCLEHTHIQDFLLHNCCLILRPYGMASSPSPSSLGDATSPPSSHAAAPPSRSVPSSPSDFSRLRRTKDVGLPLGDAVLPRRPRRSCSGDVLGSGTIPSSLSRYT